MPSPSQLIVVMPVFNEQAAISHVINDWFPVLEATIGDFILLAIDDGSTDHTLEILRGLAIKLGDRLEIITRPNRGHGQSCIEGYKIAINREIPFILQIDSDGQSAPRHFPDFWEMRERFDVIYGRRRRNDGARRVLASIVLRRLLRLVAHVDCVDANVPYRVMNSRTCAGAISAVPGNIFLANVALAVLLKKDSSIRHGSSPIGFPPRLGGEPSVPFSKFATKALELFRQLAAAGLTR